MENVKKTKKTQKAQVFNVIIIDRSGSMEVIRKGVVDGFNETLAGIKNAQKLFTETQEHNVSLVTFCGCGINYVYDKIPVAKAHQLKMSDYVPCCVTPLYDALGLTFTAMRKQVQQCEDAVVVVTIITDGLENASKEYSGPAIKQLIEELRKEGWTFTYMGANQDAVEVAKNISIRNARNFEHTEDDTTRKFQDDSDTRMNFYSRLSEMKETEFADIESPCDLPAPVRKSAYTKLADAAFDEENNK